MVEYDNMNQKYATFVGYVTFWQFYQHFSKYSSLKAKNKFLFYIKLLKTMKNITK